jgi:hypothetical protein
MRESTTCRAAGAEDVRLCARVDIVSAISALHRWAAPCTSQSLWEQAGNWVRETMQRAGPEFRMGMKLYSTFFAAGLPAPEPGYEAAIGAGSAWTGTDNFANTVRVLLPLIVRLGVATVEEVAIETLADRLREELVSRGSVARQSGLVSAWACIGEPATA